MFIMEIGMAQVVVCRTTNYTGGNDKVIYSQEQRAGNYHDTHRYLQQRNPDKNRYKGRLGIKYITIKLYQIIPLPPISLFLKQV